jgi:MoxR-like ATPase
MIQYAPTTCETKQHAPIMITHPSLPEEQSGQASRLLAKLENNVASVFLGKPETIRMALVALLAEGHLLIEDVPGIGKTLLAKALARSLGCTFHRIQFTPDLLPSDVLGTSVFHQGAGAFVFQPGPLFAQVVLADEINRATPRTQSALLEAMSDHQVSLDGQTHSLGPPFFVLATQNPYEFEGTYPLPESQLDRFLMRLRIGYPQRDAEKRILTGHRTGEPVEQLQAVLSAEEVVALQHQVRQVRVEETLADYLLDLIAATRHHPDIYLGGSTRAALALYRAAQALALIEGRDYVVPDDIKRLATAVLAHRILPRTPRQDSIANTAEQIIQEVLTQTPIP